MTETLIALAETLAWAHGLRGYDAVQLASALNWQDALGQEIVLATFDRQLWEAASHAGVRAWPDRLPAWQRRCVATRSSLPLAQRGFGSAP